MKCLWIFEEIYGNPKSMRRGVATLFSLKKINAFFFWRFQIEEDEEEEEHSDAPQLQVCTFIQ